MAVTLSFLTPLPICENSLIHLRAAPLSPAVTGIRCFSERRASVCSPAQHSTLIAGGLPCSFPPDVFVLDGAVLPEWSCPSVLTSVATVGASWTWQLRCLLPSFKAIFPSIHTCGCHKHCKLQVFQDTCIFSQPPSSSSISPSSLFFSAKAANQSAHPATSTSAPNKTKQNKAVTTTHTHTQKLCPVLPEDASFGMLILSDCATPEGLQCWNWCRFLFSMGWR